MSKGIQEIRDEEKCRRCGGECCRIYADNRRPHDMWFEDWVVSFHEAYYNNKNAYGVQPFFEPLEVHLTGKEHLWKELEAQGIDPNACQFLGRNGCIIPWEKRPLHCRTYKCNEWDHK